MKTGRAILSIFSPLYHLYFQLSYVETKQNNGVSFVHIASIETEGGTNPLGESPAFEAFQAEIGDRCEEHPVAVDLNEIGSYRFFRS